MIVILAEINFIYLRRNGEGGSPQGKPGSLPQARIEMCRRVSLLGQLGIVLAKGFISPSVEFRALRYLHGGGRAYSVSVYCRYCIVLVLVLVGRATAPSQQTARLCLEVKNQHQKKRGEAAD